MNWYWLLLLAAPAAAIPAHSAGQRGLTDLPGETLGEVVRYTDPTTALRELGRANRQLRAHVDYNRQHLLDQLPGSSFRCQQLVAAVRRGQVGGVQAALEAWMPDALCGNKAPLLAALKLPHDDIARMLLTPDAVFTVRWLADEFALGRLLAANGKQHLLGGANAAIEQFQDDHDALLLSLSLVEEHESMAAAVSQLTEEHPLRQHWRQYALATAMQTGDARLVEQTLVLGADANRWVRAGDVGAPLSLALAQCDAPVARALLHHGAHPRPHGGLLFRAARHCDADVVQLVLGLDPASLDAAQPNGQTPLHAAVLGGRLAVVETLLRAGAKVNAMDRWRRTPLLDAAFERRGEPMLRLLLQWGADPTLADHMDATPRRIAERRRYTASADVLRDAELRWRYVRGQCQWYERAWCFMMGYNR